MFHGGVYRDFMPMDYADKIIKLQEAEVLIKEKIELAIEQYAFSSENNLSFYAILELKAELNQLSNSIQAFKNAST